MAKVKNDFWRVKDTGMGMDIKKTINDAIENNAIEEEVSMILGDTRLNLEELSNIENIPHINKLDKELRKIERALRLKDIV